MSPRGFGSFGFLGRSRRLIIEYRATTRRKQGLRGRKNEGASRMGVSGPWETGFFLAVFIFRVLVNSGINFLLKELLNHACLP